ncbi:amidase [Micromonospora sp. NPDC092111]|uniref:amidase n=1 Tax=Micromonospora sp. NPDC092111 TaxID=3364289 RepID=UPI0038062765
MSAGRRPADEVAGLDATAQAELVQAGEVTAVELVDWAIERIERLNPQLNAVTTTVFERAREEARRRPAGPFAGVPYLLKDLLAEDAGVALTAGSAFLRDYVSDHTSVLVERLRAAGLVILGKTNTPEFGMSPTTEPLLHGATRNPWDPDRSTSGSSGGSAAAVASGMVPFAHGSDLSGSLRFPASACGLFGFKPTRGRNPLAPAYGDMVGGWVSEHALTVSVRDSAALLDATAGSALGDPYPAPAPAGSFLTEVRTDPGRLRIGFTTKTPAGVPGHPHTVAALEYTVALLEGLGHDLVEAELPGLGGATGDAINAVFGATAGWIIGRYVRKLGREPGPDDLEPVTRIFWDAGRGVSAGDYLLAVEHLQGVAREMARFMETVDVWLTPTMSEPPAPLGEISPTPDDPMRGLERGGRTVAYPAIAANITGNPAMSLPLWWNPEGLPIGVHALGRFGADATLFRLAGQVERARPWAGRRPMLHASNG